MSRRTGGRTIDLGDRAVCRRGYHEAVTTPRERTEEIERQILSSRASLASETKGRERDEPQDDLRTVFQRDRDRIVHAKAFRRLKHKTQVFLSPQGDHYRVRLTHTLDVSQIARTAPVSTLFVRRGSRQGALAPRDGLTRFTWSSVGPSRLE